MPVVGKVGNAAKGKSVKWVSCPCEKCAQISERCEMRRHWSKVYPPC